MTFFTSPVFVLSLKLEMSSLVCKYTFCAFDFFGTSSVLQIADSFNSLQGLAQNMIRERFLFCFVYFGLRDYFLVTLRYKPFDPTCAASKLRL